jgi:hypothetical protein
MWVGGGKNPVALMRTSWTDTAAIFVGIKGGSGSVNHAHMDVGSFVMDLGGVRWAMDLGAQDYESLESKGMQIFGRTQDAQRWTIFRYVNQAHNTLTINDQHQLVNGYAPIISSSSSKDFMSAVTDLSEVYKGSVVKAQRGIAIVDGKWVAVRDEIETADSPVTIRWTMVTPATVTTNGKNIAHLTLDGKQILMIVDDAREAIIKTWPTDPPPNSYDAPNPGTIRTGFELTVPARTKKIITVLLAPESSLVRAAMEIGPLRPRK